MRRASLTAWLNAAVLLAAALWVGWPTLAQWQFRWANDAQYSHGYFVPAFALVLLWLRRPMLAFADARPSTFGLALLVVAAGMRLVGAYFYFVWVEQIALLPMLAALCLILGGWPTLRWAWPAIAFLAFMVPLPGRLDGALAHPLQRVGTQASTYVLQLLGVPAVAEGNVILLSEVPLGVVEACSGLRMLMVFFALCTGVALVMPRPIVERVVVVLSAAPIALVVNVMRIVSTAVLHEWGFSWTAEFVYHDLAGWLMMVAAVGLLWGELWLLSRLLRYEEPDEPAPVPTSLLEPEPAQVPRPPRAAREDAIVTNRQPSPTGVTPR